MSRYQSFQTKRWYDREYDCLVYVYIYRKRLLDCILGTSFAVVCLQIYSTISKGLSSICKYSISFIQVNHFPGSYHMGRKDRLWNNINAMAELWGNEHFGFLPYTYILPRDSRQLRNYLGWVSPRCVIVKPPNSGTNYIANGLSSKFMRFTARGSGIKLVRHFTQIPKKATLIAQQ